MSEEATKTEEKKEDLSADSLSIISQIEEMSVLELSKLVKALEDKFGVVAAAAPVAVAGAVAGGSADSGAAEEASTINVILADCGDKKIQVLKAIREITGLGLKEAKELVDNTPKAVKESVEKDEADTIKKQLEELGAKVEFK